MNRPDDTLWAREPDEGTVSRKDRQGRAGQCAHEGVRFPSLAGFGRIQDDDAVTVALAQIAPTARYERLTTGLDHFIRGAA